jgi:hypothetical protein
VGFFWDRLNVHTFNCHRRADRRVEGGCGGMGGQRNGYQHIYCLPPAGGRIRSQGNYYCLPPAGGRIRSQGNYYCLPPVGVLHSQNKVIKCAAYGVAQARGVEVWVDRWAERWI